MSSTSEPLETRLLFARVAQAPPVWAPHSLTAVGDTMYFFASSPTINLNGPNYGEQLYKSDGTVAGTVRVSTKLAQNSFYPSGSTAALGGRLYFFNGEQLWISDGTDSGTVKLSNFASGSLTSMVATDNAVYFVKAET